MEQERRKDEGNRSAERAEKDAKLLYDSFRETESWHSMQVGYWEMLRKRLGIEKDGYEDKRITSLLDRKDENGRLDAWKALNEKWISGSMMGQEDRLRFLGDMKAANTIEQAQRISRRELMWFVNTVEVRVSPVYGNYDYFMERIKERAKNNDYEDYEHGWLYVYNAINTTIGEREQTGGAASLIAPPEAISNQYLPEDYVESGGPIVIIKEKSVEEAAEEEIPAPYPVHITGDAGQETAGTERKKPSGAEEPHMKALRKLAKSSRMRQRLLAAKLSEDEGILDGLSKDVRKRVRKAVAANARTGQSTVDRMALTDPSLAVKRIIANRDDLSQETRADLAIGNGVRMMEIIARGDTNPKILNITAHDIYEGSLYRSIRKETVSLLAPRLNAAKIALVDNLGTSEETLDYMERTEPSRQIKGLVYGMKVAKYGSAKLLDDLARDLYAEDSYNRLHNIKLAITDNPETGIETLRFVRKQESMTGGYYGALKDSIDRRIGELEAEERDESISKIESRLSQLGAGYSGPEENPLRLESDLVTHDSDGKRVQVWYETGGAPASRLKDILKARDRLISRSVVFVNDKHVKEYARLEESGIEVIPISQLDSFTV